MKKFFAFAAITAGVLALTAAPAFAHATLEGAQPAQNAQLPAAEPPKAVTLDFSETVQIPDDAVQVRDATAKVVPIGTPHAGGDASVVTASLPNLKEGTYVVSYRVVSADSHPIQGAYTFSVGTPSQSVDASTLAGTHGSRTVGVAFGFIRALAFFGVLVFVGGVVFLRAIWPGVVDRPRVRMLMVGAWVAALLTAVLGIGFQAAYSTGKGLGSITDASLIGDVMDTHFGQAWLARALLLLLSVPLATAVLKKRTPAFDAVAVVVGIFLLGTFSYAGHADNGRWVPLALFTDLTHLSAAAVWLGGVAVLAVALWDPERTEGASDAVSRFSTVAAPAIALVVISGTVQAIRQVESWSALVHTTYGRLLFAKLMLVGVVVVSASASRDILRTRLMRAMERTLDPNVTGAENAYAEAALGGDGETGAVATLEATEQAPVERPFLVVDEPEVEDVRDLRNAVWVEVIVAIAVLMITAILVNVEPAREARARSAANAAYFAVLPSEGVHFEVSISPKRVGANTITIVPRGHDGAVAPTLQMTASMQQESNNIAAIDIPMTQESDGSYRGQLDVPIAGTWELDINALRTETDSSVAATNISFS